MHFSYYIDNTKKTTCVSFIIGKFCADNFICNKQFIETLEQLFIEKVFKFKFFFRLKLNYIRAVHQCIYFNSVGILKLSRHNKNKMKTSTIFIFFVAFLAFDGIDSNPSQSLNLFNINHPILPKEIDRRVGNGLSRLGHGIKDSFFGCPDDAHGRGARCWFNKRGKIFIHIHFITN